MPPRASFAVPSIKEQAPHRKGAVVLHARRRAVDGDARDQGFAAVGADGSAREQTHLLLDRLAGLQIDQPGSGLRRPPRRVEAGEHALAASSLMASSLLANSGGRAGVQASTRLRSESADEPRLVALGVGPQDVGAVAVGKGVVQVPGKRHPRAFGADGEDARYELAGGVVFGEDEHLSRRRAMAGGEREAGEEQQGERERGSAHGARVFRRPTPSSERRGVPTVASGLWGTIGRLRPRWRGAADARASAHAA